MNLLESLALHFMQTLPDSTFERRRVLEAIRAELPRNNETRLKAVCTLRLMDAFEQAQLDLFQKEQL